MAAPGRELYEDQDARIPIVARSPRLQEWAGYIEADPFKPSRRKRLQTGDGPYIFNTFQQALLANSDYATVTENRGAVLEMLNKVEDAGKHFEEARVFSLLTG